jgi:hypothetical protein
MTVLWKFKAVIRSTGAVFYLDEAIPFVGDYRQAQTQAKERRTRWERQNGRLIDHVEPSFCILPDKQQIPVSLFKLAGYALVGVIALAYSDEHTSHNIIAFEKNGTRQTDTIQSECFQDADNTVNDYLADARQKQRFDICAVAYNGVVIKDNTMAKAFISRMYGPELGDNCFVFQTFRPGSRTVPLAFTGAPKLNLGNHIIEQGDVWNDILMEGFCQHPEARCEWDHIKQVRSGKVAGP